MVEDRVGVTKKNQVAITILVIWSIIVTIVSGGVLFVGGGKSLEVLLVNSVSWIGYIAMMSIGVFGVFYLNRQGFSVYLGESLMGLMPYSDMKVIRSPIFKLFSGVMFFTGLALLLGILKLFAGSIPFFQVFGFAQIFMAYEPVVTAETLILNALYLTLARRLIINVTGGQNFAFFLIMIGLVCTSLFGVGVAWHSTVYGKDVGNLVASGFLFFFMGVLTVVFGDVIYSYLLHSILNIFNTAKEIFSSDFYLAFVGFFWVIAFLTMIAYVLIISSMRSDNPRASLSES